PARGTALRPPLSPRRPAHRGGLAALPDPGPFRCRLLRPFQMQSAPCLRLSRALGLYARALSPAGRGGDGRSRELQDALLRKPAAREPERGDPARATDRFLDPFD